MDDATPAEEAALTPELDKDTERASTEATPPEDVIREPVALSDPLRIAAATPALDVVLTPVFAMEAERVEDATPPDEAKVTAVIAAVTTRMELATPAEDPVTQPVAERVTALDCATGSWLPSPIARLPIAKSPMATRSPDLG